MISTELIRKVQLHQIKMMSELQQLFTNEKLVYFAIGGTALGAVRHKGFIPWDDDIDIAMPRQDYERFITLQHKLPSHLFIQNFHTDKEYWLHFAKVRDKSTLFIENSRKNQNINHGIFIDIFPWDNIMNSSDIKNEVKIMSHKFRRISMSNYKRKNIFRKLKTKYYQWLYRDHDQDSLFKKIEETYTKYNHIDTGVIGNASFNDAIKISDLYPLNTAKFESLELPIPKNIDVYLNHKYGDYMKIPPENERNGHKPIKIQFNSNDE
jgi:lipopolysaccharide cholinephosphotransferase